MILKISFKILSYSDLYDIYLEKSNDLIVSHSYCELLIIHCKLANWFMIEEAVRDEDLSHFRNLPS